MITEMLGRSPAAFGHDTVRPGRSHPVSSARVLGDDGRVAIAMVDGPEVGLYLGQLGEAPGLCAVERGVAHDFVTGARTELPPVDQDAYYGARVFWW
jgi:hypothetical protein